MGLFTSPTSFRLANGIESPSITSRSTFTELAFGSIVARSDHDSHPSLGHLTLLVFEAVMEVVCVSLPGYIVARQGMFDADQQKFVANLNVALFTPCLIFTKLASQLTAEKLIDLAVIPFIFVVQTLVSYLVSRGVSKAFGFGKRPANFVTAMGVFGNSNSLPISLVISLSQTLKGLHWDQIPGDNDEEVAARGILYLLIFQQLGQLVRWSWGYHVLLAPAETYEDHSDETAIEEGRYRDEPEEELIPGLDGENEHAPMITKHSSSGKVTNGTVSEASFESGGRTPINTEGYASASDDEGLGARKKLPGVHPTPTNGNVFAGDRSNGNLTTFPSIRTPILHEEQNIPPGMKGWIPLVHLHAKRSINAASNFTASRTQRFLDSLPASLRRVLLKTSTALYKFFAGLWEFMNPPLWAMLLAVIVASIPSLQKLFFEDGSFIANSVTRAVAQSGGVAVPLILVVLGANLARNTLPKEALDVDSEENKIGKKLLIASLISRMLLPTLIMAPLLALAAKFVPVSILDDPIFVIVCFLLTGAPSALQLAQICQINGVYEGVMSKLLFQSYVIWILPSTLILVMCALEVVEWAVI
ncbi:auxin efflux carrier [Coleophoma crateriformis]|uniref:Auxin efflux carrier n=1 Tax=Coleophoma crateriformis TaxID=565419 RepID=A0A3D8T1V7_9HELO|nr:auxin efflux carrier [Coleophoma crateriformis]